MKNCLKNQQQLSQFWCVRNRRFRLCFHLEYLGGEKKSIKIFINSPYIATFWDQEVAFAHVVDATIELNNIEEYCCVFTEALIDLLDNLGFAWEARPVVFNISGQDNLDDNFSNKKQKGIVKIYIVKASYLLAGD